MPSASNRGPRELWREVGSVLLAGTGIGTGPRPPESGTADEPVIRSYGAEQPAKTPKGPPRISDDQFAADLNSCAEYCYVFQCNGCSSDSHLFRCTSRTRGDYFVCGSGTCADHCRHQS